MGQDNINHSGIVEYTLKDSKGRLKDVRTVKNVVTDDGKEAMAALFLDGVSEDAFKYIALGSDSTSASSSDSSLGDEITDNGGSRAEASVERVTTDVNNDTSQLEHTFTFSGDLSIKESGVFNADSDGVMACRQTFSELNVTDGDELTVKWKVQHK